MPRNFLIQWHFFAELFKCSLCIGFHVGIWHAVLLWYADLISKYDALLLPTASAAVCWAADSIVQMIQAADVYLMSHRRTSSQ